MRVTADSCEPLESTKTAMMTSWQSAPDRIGSVAKSAGQIAESV